MLASDVAVADAVFAGMRFDDLDAATAQLAGQRAHAACRGTRIRGEPAVDDQGLAQWTLGGDLHDEFLPWI